MTYGEPQKQILAIDHTPNRKGGRLHCTLEEFGLTLPLTEGKAIECLSQVTCRTNAKNKSNSDVIRICYVRRRILDIGFLSSINGRGLVRRPSIGGAHIMEIGYDSKNRAWKKTRSRTNCPTCIIICVVGCYSRTRDLRNASFGMTNSFIITEAQERRPKHVLLVVSRSTPILQVPLLSEYHRNIRYGFGPLTRQPLAHHCRIHSTIWRHLN